jgi:DNA-directed RNA polymerase subunit RPC12/RpoP
MGKKYYVRCPSCRSRAVRTGKKVKEVRTINGDWIYIREYKCPKCGCLFTHSPFHNAIFNVPIEEMLKRWQMNIEEIEQ